MLNTVLVVVDVIVALLLIFLILLHSGRGGGLSDMFGGGQLGGSMAGSTVVERNLDRLTVIADHHLHVHHGAAGPPARLTPRLVTKPLKKSTKHAVRRDDGA